MLLLSFLVFSAPILLVVADALLPSALFSALSPVVPSSSSLMRNLSNYDFRYSLIDIPLVSLVRSAVILCVYSLCDGPKLSRGPYLSVATVCSVASLMFVSLKASYVFGNDGGGGGRVMEVALFTCSVALAIGHVVVAYRTSCRERRKMLVYRIDIEAIQNDEIERLGTVTNKKSNCVPTFNHPIIETPTPLPTLKVRKEKMVDRISALHELVSPFGKADTVSVLQEAIEYIKFLNDQVNVLSTPYLKNGVPIQRLQNGDDKARQDLKSRGLCLVPISSPFPVAAENTTDLVEYI